MQQTNTAVNTKNLSENSNQRMYSFLLKHEDSLLDTFRTDSTVKLLEYVLDMLQQPEIEIDNEISSDVAFFLSKAIDNLNYHFEQTRETFENIRNKIFEILKNLEDEYNKEDEYNEIEA